MPTQQEAVRGEMEHTKLNQAFILRLVKHNTTLFSDFHKKTWSDWGRRGGDPLTEVTNKAVLLTRGEYWQTGTQFFLLSPRRRTGSAGRESCQLHVTGL